MELKKKIYVVFKTHFDIGYTELAEEVIRRYGSKMLGDVVNTCEGTQKFDEGHRYVWTMAAWPLIQSLKPEIAESEYIARAKELLKQGQIAWHALPYTTHTEFCGLEEFIRGMYFSRELSEEYGIWPVSAKMTDVPGHTWILPSLLYKAGIKFLHLGCNPGCMPPDVPRLFFWEGPDGNRVLTFYNKGYYGSSLIPPEDWQFPVWLALMQTNDNIGPQGSEVVEKILKDVEMNSPGTEVVIGTMDDFYRDLEQYSLENIPVVRGDLADTWIHGVATYPDKVGTLRALRHTLTDVEKVLSLMLVNKIFDVHGIESYIHSISKAYEKAILFGEHTWGLCVATALGWDRHYNKEAFLKDKTDPRYARIETSWKEQRERVDDAENEVNRVLPCVMSSLADCVPVQGSKLVVFNGLGWNRDAFVYLDSFREQLQGRWLIDVSTGEKVEIREINGRLEACVRNMLAFGYKTLSICDEKLESKKLDSITINIDEGVLENKWYRIKVNTVDGTVQSLIEKHSRYEWVDSTKPGGFGQYRYDIYGDEDFTEFIRAYAYRFYGWLLDDLGRLSYPSQKHLTFMPSTFTIDSEKGNGFASIIMKAEISGESVEEYGNAREIITRITIYDDNPYIDFAFNINGKEETPFLEAGHFIFPINLKQPKIRINKLGSVVDPAIDIVKDANTMLYCCENWVDLSDGERGMAFVAYDAPLFSIGDQAIFKFRREYSEEEPIIYFNIFNNQWGTNFPQWMGGDYSFRYRLIPHNGDWRQGNVAHLVLESVNPLLAGFSSGMKTGQVELPISMEWIKQVEGMEVLAVKPAENCDGVILRLREITGIAHKVRINLGSHFKSVSRSDLLERIQEELAVNAYEFAFDTTPFEIHTFYLKSK